MLALSIASAVHGRPLSPDQEKATFHLADPALIVELVAAEPEVLSPVAIAWDAEGRLFVAEMTDYPTGPTGGQIRMLEDRDGDGRYETATVFAEGLPFPNGVLPWNGGVLVTAAPDVLFLEDTNGDGRADQRRVVLTGFAEGNQQLRVNSLLLGLDGWIYGANGRSDGEIHRPGDSNRVSLRGHDFRFHPQTGALEAVAGRSQFGMARDDWNHRFLSWNTIPVRHEVIPERYLAHNPRLNVADAVVDLMPAGDHGEVFPLTPAPQTFNRESVSHFNALAGLALYHGDALPERYRGNAFVGETLRNLVHRRVLEPDGVSFVAQRIEQGQEFLASADPWFHPVNFATGPDGALYVVDFYRQWVEHPGYVPANMRGNIAWRTGAEHGRLWRVRARDEFRPRASRLKPNLARAATMALAGHLEDSNGWRRDTAQRLLLEKRDPAAIPPLRNLARGSAMAEARALALHTLAALDALDEDTAFKALDDPHPRVRETALRLAESRLKQSPALSRRAVALAEDADARVRLQTALSLGEADLTTRIDGLSKLAARKDLDRRTALGIRASATSRPWRLLEHLWNARLGNAAPALMGLMRDLAADVSAASETSDRQGLLAILTKPQHLPLTKTHLLVFAGFAEGIPGNDETRLQEFRDWTCATEHATLLGELMNSARDTATQSGIPTVLRDAALVTLARAGTATASESLVALLLPPYPDDVQTGAAAAIIGAGDSSLVRRAYAVWSRCQVSTRRKLLAGSVRSSAATALLVEALEQGRVAPSELDAAVRQSLLQTKSPDLKASLLKLLGPDVASDRRIVLDEFAPAVKLAGDSKRGAVSFARLCLQCHALQDRGHRVGPDLAGIASRSKETLLSDILDPSRQVAPDFVSYSVSLADGDTLTGLIVSESASALMLRRANLPDETIPRARLAEVRADGRSLMPDGLETGLTPQDLADLIEFLLHPNPALLPADP